MFKLNLTEIKSITTSQQKEYDNEHRIVQYSYRDCPDIDNSKQASSKKSSVHASSFFDFALILHIIQKRKGGLGIILVPILIFSITVICGICAIYYGSLAEYYSTVREAKLVTESYANLIELKLEKSFLSLYSLRSAIYAENDGTKLSSRYEKLASSITAATGNSVKFVYSFRYHVFPLILSIIFIY